MGVEFKDYYKTLGVSRTASTDEISKAYKKLARKYHPDLNQNDKKAEECFKEVSEANEVLKDPEKRKMYDQLGPDWKNNQQFRRPPGFENMRSSPGGAQFSGAGFSDFFETLFGGSFQAGGSPFGNAQFKGNPFGNEGYGATKKGSDVNAEITLTLEDAFHGGKKNISLQGGRSLEVAIPAGIKPGSRIRLTGQGAPGMGGPAGDLFLKVNIAPDTRFLLEDTDIIYDLLLAPWDAVLGCTVRVPTLTGEVDLTVAPGVSSGKKFRLRGKGLGTGTAKGDQLIRIGIAIPDIVTDEERALWESLRTLGMPK